MPRHVQQIKMRGGFLSFFSKLRNGESPSFWDFLSSAGKDIQGVIDKAAPITSKIAAPLASALTGVTIPDLGSLANQDAMAVAQAKQTALEILEKNKGKLSQLMDKGVKTGTSLKMHGAGYKLIKPKSNF